MEKILPETNKKPENNPLENEIPDLGKPLFLGADYVSFRDLSSHVSVIMDFSINQQTFPLKKICRFSSAKMFDTNKLEEILFPVHSPVDFGWLKNMVQSIENLPTKKSTNRSQVVYVGSFYVNQPTGWGIRQLEVESIESW